MLSVTNEFDDEPVRKAWSQIQQEISMVGAGRGGWFTNNQELHVMKYIEAMQTKDKGEWQKAAMEEYEIFVKHKVFKPVKLEEVPKGEDVDERIGASR